VTGKELHHRSAKGAVPIGRYLDSRLVRMVVRVDARLPKELTDIIKHLFNETGTKYSRSAIVRGLIAVGLASVQLGLLEAPPLLERLFKESRVPRGRKPGARWTPIEEHDLTAKDEDEHQDEHSIAR
jgi:hypothetical protein